MKRLNILICLLLVSLFVGMGCSDKGSPTQAPPPGPNPGESGGPCIEGSICNPGLICDNGTCKVLPSPPVPGDVGDPCDEATPCKEGLTCDAVAKKCGEPPEAPPIQSHWSPLLPLPKYQIKFPDYLRLPDTLQIEKPRSFSKEPIAEANGPLTNLSLWSCVGKLNFPGNFTSKIVVGNAIYIGTSGGGVFKSIDGGNNWLEINNGLTTPWVNSLLYVGNTNAIYAGTIGGVFKSTDGGDVWTPVNNGLADLNVDSLLSVGNAIYAGTWGGGVFMSIDGGENWVSVSKGLTQIYIQTLSSIDNTIYAGTTYGLFKMEILE